VKDTLKKVTGKGHEHEVSSVLCSCGSANRVVNGFIGVLPCMHACLSVQYALCMFYLVLQIADCANPPIMITAIAALDLTMNEMAAACI
jgi:hypothetical protein